MNQRFPKGGDMNLGAKAQWSLPAMDLPKDLRQPSPEPESECSQEGPSQLQPSQQSICGNPMGTTEKKIHKKNQKNENYQDDFPC